MTASIRYVCMCVCVHMYVTKYLDGGTLDHVQGRGCKQQELSLAYTHQNLIHLSLTHTRTPTPHTHTHTHKHTHTLTAARSNNCKVEPVSNSSTHLSTHQRFIHVSIPNHGHLIHARTAVLHKFINPIVNLVNFAVTGKGS